MKTLFRKRYLWVAVIAVLLLLLSAPVYVFSDVTGSDVVTFDVTSSMTLTASSVPLGPIVAGQTSTRDANPVVVTSNVAWQLMAYADNFSDLHLTDPTIIAIENLKINDTVIKNDDVTPPIILSTQEASLTQVQPLIKFEVHVPMQSEYIGKAFTTTVTYVLAADSVY